MKQKYYIDPVSLEEWNIIEEATGQKIESFTYAFQAQELCEKLNAPNRGFEGYIPAFFLGQ